MAFIPDTKSVFTPDSPPLLDKVANATPLAALARGVGSVAGGGKFDMSPKPIDNSEMGANDYLTKQLPDSALKTVGTVANAVIHPIKTTGDMLNAGMGVVEKYSPFSMIGKSTGILPNEMPHEKYFNGMMQNYAEKYGSPNKAISTLYHDPFGVGLDAAIATEPFNGALRKSAVDTAVGTKDAIANAADASGKIMHNTNLGENINPNMATPAIRENLLSMNPKSLESIKVSPDAIAEAQAIKAKHGITSVPSIDSAESNFGQVMKDLIKNNPDAKIPVTNVTDVINKNIDNLNPSDVTAFRNLIERKPTYSEAISGMTEPTVPRELSPQEFSDLRRRAVDMSQNGNNPFGFRVKSALDSDVSVVSPELAKAKAGIRLSHIMKPVTSYLDNPNFEISNEDMLRGAQDVSQTARRQKLSGLLDGKSKEVFDALKTDSRQQGFLKNAKKLAGLGAEGGGIFGIMKKALGK